MSRIHHLVHLVSIIPSLYAELSPFEEKCLKEVNAYRSLRWGNSTEYQLVWDDELAREAQVWADTVIRTEIWRHDPDLLAQGELAWISKGYGDEENQPYIAIEDWFNELCDYQNSCGFTVITGHMTQLLWKDTKRVGFARSRCRHGYFIILARFWPCGNYDQPWLFHHNVGCSDHPKLNALRREIDCDAFHDRREIYFNKLETLMKYGNKSLTFEWLFGHLDKQPSEKDFLREDDLH